MMADLPQEFAPAVEAIRAAVVEAVGEAEWSSSATPPAARVEARPKARAYRPCQARQLLGDTPGRGTPNDVGGDRSVRYPRRPTRRLRGVNDEQEVIRGARHWRKRHPSRRSQRKARCAQDRARSIRGSPPGVIVDGQIVDQSALVSALKKLWKSGKFSSKKVAFAVIDNGVMIRQMELPWMEEKDFNESLRYQVDDDLPVEGLSVGFDYHRLGKIIGPTSTPKLIGQSIPLVA